MSIGLNFQILHQTLISEYIILEKGQNTEQTNKTNLKCDRNCPEHGMCPVYFELTLHEDTFIEDMQSRISKSRKTFLQYH